MNARDVDLKDVVQAGFEQLMEWRLLQNHAFSTPLAKLYAEVRCSCLSGDPQSEWKTDPDYFVLPPEEQLWLTLAFAVRHQIVAQKICCETVEDLLKTAGLSLLIQGESQCIAGRAYSVSGDFARSALCYQQSYQSLNACGATSKALTALQNFIAVKGLLAPDKRFIQEYELLVKQAKIQKNSSVLGIALLNLSREYQLAGCLKLAIQHSQDCLQAVQGERGTQHYYLSLLHHAHLLIESRAWKEFEEIREQLQMAPFSSVQEGLKVLDAIRNDQVKNVKEGLLTSTWRNRLNQLVERHKIPLSGLEKRLLAALAPGAKSKYELIDEIYSEESLDFETLENRFKNLLARMRKKYPNLLEMNCGRYRLSKESDLGRRFLRLGS